MNNTATEAFSEPEDVGFIAMWVYQQICQWKKTQNKIWTGTCKFNKSHHETIVQVCVHVPPYFQTFTKGTDKA
jgi:hypothetical protein